MERLFKIQVEADISVRAFSKKEALKKAEEAMKFLEVHSFKVNPEKRTHKQNNSIHLYCDMLAQEFNQAGLDMKVVLKPSVDIEWSGETVKKYVWKPIMKSLFGYDSTTKLKKIGEIDRVWEHINRHLSERFAEWIMPIPFPSKKKEDKPNYEYPESAEPTF